MTGSRTSIFVQGGLRTNWSKIRGWKWIQKAIDLTGSPGIPAGIRAYSIFALECKACEQDHTRGTELEQPVEELVNGYAKNQLIDPC